MVQFSLRKFRKFRKSCLNHFSNTVTAWLKITHVGYSSFSYNSNIIITSSNDKELTEIHLTAETNISKARFGNERLRPGPDKTPVLIFRILGMWQPQPRGKWTGGNAIEIFSNASKHPSVVFGFDDEISSFCNVSTTRKMTGDLHFNSSGCLGDAGQGSSKTFDSMSMSSRLKLESPRMGFKSVSAIRIAATVTVS